MLLGYSLVLKQPRISCHPWNNVLGFSFAFKLPTVWPSSAFPNTSLIPFPPRSSLQADSSASFHRGPRHHSSPHTQPWFKCPLPSPSYLSKLLVFPDPKLWSCPFLPGPLTHSLLAPLDHPCLPWVSLTIRDFPHWGGLFTKGAIYRGAVRDWRTTAGYAVP